MMLPTRNWFDMRYVRLYVAAQEQGCLYNLWWMRVRIQEINILFAKIKYE